MAFVQLFVSAFRHRVVELHELDWRFSELTQNMRQKDDLHYAEMMNRFRVGSPTDDDIRAIMSRFISVITGKGIL